MDFTGSVIRQFNNLSPYWWAWMIAVGLVTAVICKAGRVSTKKTLWISLVAAFALFILFATVIGRKHVSVNAEWVPFWSYRVPKLRTEIILNYQLFFPLGIALYGAFGEKLGLKVALFGFGLSCAVELTQLIFWIGLFEFDDIFGNSMGCLIGALLAMGISKLIARIKASKKLIRWRKATNQINK